MLTKITLNTMVPSVHMHLYTNLCRPNDLSHFTNWIGKVKQVHQKEKNWELSHFQNTEGRAGTQVRTTTKPVNYLILEKHFRFPLLSTPTCPLDKLHIYLIQTKFRHMQHHSEMFSPWAIMVVVLLYHSQTIWVSSSSAIYQGPSMQLRLQ